MIVTDDGTIPYITEPNVMGYVVLYDCIIHDSESVFRIQNSYDVWTGLDCIGIGVLKYSLIRSLIYDL